MIFIEGPDLAGKTTLCEHMAYMLRVPFWHMVAPGEEGDWHNVTTVLSEFEYSNAIVFDRIVLSDFAYRPIWPRTKPNTIEHLQRFVAYAKATGSVFVQADAPDEVIALRYRSRGDEAVELNEEHIISIARRYRRIFDALRHLVPVLKYDSSEQTPESFVATNYDRLIAATNFTAVRLDDPSIIEAQIPADLAQAVL